MCLKHGKVFFSTHVDRFQMCQLSNVSGWPFAEANLSSEVSQPDYDLGQGKGEKREPVPVSSVVLAFFLI